MTSYLLASFMILSLKRRISQGELKQSLLSSRLNTLYSQSTALSESINNKRQMASNIFGFIGNSYSNMFGGNFNNMTSLVAAKQRIYDDAVSKFTSNSANDGKDPDRDPTIAAYKQALEAQQKASDTQGREMYNQYNAYQTAQAATTNAINSVFDKEETAVKTTYHAQEENIERQMTEIDGQLKLWNKQLEKYEKLQDDSAEKVAPTFGLK